jgi:hypothetical protein
MNRRLFSKIGFLTPLLPFSLSKSSDTIDDNRMENIFVHHVYFWLKNPESKDDFDQLVAGLETLSKVKSLKSFHLGIPASTNRDVIDGSYSISWLTIFHSLKDEEKYQKDPIHLDFVKNCQHLWAKVVVYDSIDQ